jgi:nucleoside-diphosphate-sugar epimerase
VDKFLNSDKITIYGDGLQTRTFVHIDDLVKGILSAIQWRSGEYYFGTEQNHTILDLAKATKKPIHFLPKRDGELYQSRVENTTPFWISEIDVMDYICSRS